MRRLRPDARFFRLTMICLLRLYYFRQREAMIVVSTLLMNRSAAD